MEIYIGIDPGVTGCIAIQDTSFDRRDPLRWTLIDMPTSQIKMKDGGMKSEYQIRTLFEIMSKYKGALATVELLHAVTSKVGKFQAGGQVNFSLGESTMIISCALTMNDIAIHRMPPQTWKAKMLLGVSDKSDKEAIRLKTIDMYPHLAERLNLKKHHNRAEAILINECGRKHFYELSTAD